MTWKIVDLIVNLVSCHCHQFLYSNKHFSCHSNEHLFFYTFERKKKLSLLYWQSYKLYSVLIVYKKTTMQCTLVNGESRNSNYDDLLWVHELGTEVDRERGRGTSSKNRLESPLYIYIYIYIYI